jgi:F-type H+-transporting ATPase subunit a
MSAQFLDASPHVVAANIEVGVHETVKVFGVTLNWDTILTSLIAGVVLLGLAFYMRAKSKATGVPSKLQLMFEGVVQAVNKQVEETMGIKVAPYVVPMAVTLFLYILLCNWIGLIPSGHPERLPAPTADINLALAMAFIVIVPMHIMSIRRRGPRHYVKHYFQPYAVLFPINVIEEAVKPFTLALRLFGNVFAGTVMIGIIALLPASVLWLPNVLWKGVDLLVAIIQAFIFALLTILYFGFALEEEEH